jgi:hemolysin III
MGLSSFFRVFIFNMKSIHKLNQIFRDPFSGLSHLLGAILSLVGLILLLIRAIPEGSPSKIVAFSIFGASMILLYSASATYHLVIGSEKLIRLLRKLDHLMIYFLIAGTYTPYCLLALKGELGIVLLVITWSLAILGFMLAIFWIDAPRWLQAVIYCGMGWSVIFAIKPIYQILPTGSFNLLMLGGGAYTFGALIYAIKRPNLWPNFFGFHELWHLFVIGGTLCHFLSIYIYL